MLWHHAHQLLAILAIHVHRDCEKQTSIFEQTHLVLHLAVRPEGDRRVFPCSDKPVNQGTENTSIQAVWMAGWRDVRTQNETCAPISDSTDMS
jgi:hypothetical protein